MDGQKLKRKKRARLEKEKIIIYRLALEDLEEESLVSYLPWLSRPLFLLADANGVSIFHFGPDCLNSQWSKW